MVQHVFTPWRDRRELLAVRRQFYPNGTGQTRARASPEQLKGQRAAVARVAVWARRGHCPHMVESTAQLIGAVLNDMAPVTLPMESNTAPQTRTATQTAPGGGGAPSASFGGSFGSSASSMAAGASAYTARMAYAAAFSRFVTGLLDSHQDRARKLSMYGLAQTVGLPAGFVELRHQATHEALPPLRRLRVATHQALEWIWGYYWANLEGAEDAEGAERGDSKTEGDSADSEDALRTALLRYVDDANVTAVPPSFVERWRESRVLSALSAIGRENTVNSRTLRCIRLSRAVLRQARGNQPNTETEGTGPEARRWTLDNLDLDAMRAQVARDREALNQQAAREEERRAATESEAEDAFNEGDVAMAGTEEPTDETSQEKGPEPGPEPELPAPRPRWTRYEGEWTPRPIGVA